MLIGRTDVCFLTGGNEVTVLLAPVAESLLDTGLSVSLMLNGEQAAGFALALMNELRGMPAWEGYRKGMIDALSSWGEPRTMESDIAEGRI